ncbi:MAG: hypothetical protein HKO59_11465, partial [Phycisphaerales bacterium]|nr:hypothetical protein [Phycisphaerales bacterium]
VLDSSDSALVHMETLRRATLEANADRAVAHALFARLVARTLDAEATGSPDALRWFDAGYLAQCYDQINMRVVRSHGRTRGLTGYAWVQHALELRGDDAEMEFGAAVMTVMAGLPEHTLHVARVEALAAPGSLVARNLEQHRTNRWKHFESRATKRTDR